WGFNWQLGPFELWQAIGYDTLRERMLKEDCQPAEWCKPDLKFYRPTPESPDWFATGPDYQIDAMTEKSRAIERAKHICRLPVFENKQDRRLVVSNSSASLMDIGDGVA